MNEQARPEELLKQARAEAKAFFEKYDAELQAIESAMKQDAALRDNMLSRDQLSLFLRSLSSELNNALTEVRSSSERLANIAENIREHQ
jgi:signal transduction histidine kinase